MVVLSFQPLKHYENTVNTYCCSITGYIFALEKLILTQKVFLPYVQII
jgi:hypothetical protein